MAVKSNARHLVACSDESVVPRLASPFLLGPIDQQAFPVVKNEVIYIYKKPASTPSDDFIPSGLVRQSLARLLDYYPHLTGRFEDEPRTKGYAIGQLGTGIEFVEAIFDAHLADIAALDRTAGCLILTNLPDNGQALLPPTAPTMEDFYHNSILAVQHTRFGCGGVALGIRLHHMVCDACGYFQLVRDLADIYRQLRHSQLDKSADVRPALPQPPVIHSYLSDPSELSPEERQTVLARPQTRWLVRDLPVPDPIPATDAADAADATSSAAPAAQPPVRGRVLRFSGAALQALKHRATDPNGSGWVSTFEALSAYFTQITYQARLRLLLQTHQVPRAEAIAQISPGFWAPLDVRGPSGLALPPRYFGNAVYGAFGHLPRDLLADEGRPLWAVAQAIHAIVHAPTQDDIVHNTRWYAAQPDVSRLQINYSFDSGNFTVTQWNKFHTYSGVALDADPQSGDPIAPSLVTSPFNAVSLVDGMAKMLTTEEDLQQPADSGLPAAIDVNLSLSEPLWALLDEDPLFRSFCS